MKTASPDELHRKSGPRIFLYAAPCIDACAAFIKESRMKTASPDELHRKTGPRIFLYAAPSMDACVAGNPLQPKP
jgi:hypothetical protein